MADNSQVRECPICRDAGPLQEHHITPREFGGEHGPTIFICAKCHMAIHHQAANLMGKGPRKDYLPPGAIDRAMPLVEQIIIAKLRFEEQKGINEKKSVIFHVDGMTLRKLHVLKADKGFKSLDKFLAAWARVVTKDL